MQFSISKTTFLTALNRCAPGADPNRPGAYSGTVLLDAQSNRIVCTATNTSILVQDVAAAEVKRPGKFALSHRKLVALVQIMGDQVTLTLDKGVVRISSGTKRKGQLAGLIGEDFPRHDESPSERQQLPAGPFQRVVARVEHAVGESDRAFLDGVHLESRDGVLHAVAMCGSRIAWAQEPVQGLTGEQDWFLPRYALKAFLGLCALDESLAVAKTDRAVFFWGGETLLVAALPADPFPQWRQIVGDVPKTSVGRVNGYLLTEAVKAVLAAEPHDIALEFQGKELRVLAQDPESGNKAEDVLPYDPEGDLGDCSSRVQGRFLKDALVSANADVVLSLGKIGHAPQGKEELPKALICTTDDGYFCLIMPVR